MRVAEAVAQLAERTHPERAAAWDAVGLQVGDPAATVHSVAVVHEVTEAVARRLEADPVDLVISYHPLMFRPIGRLLPDRSPGGRAVRLLAAGVSVVVTHTDFDVMRGGMADAMADALGLRNVRGFAPVARGEQAKIVTFVPADHVDVVIDHMSAAGAGTIGDYHHCAFTAPGEGRFVAGERASPAAGTAGAANREPEVRVEVIAPSTRADSVVSALIAAHPYEEPAFDVYSSSSNQALGGRIGEFDRSWPELLDLVVSRFRPEGLRSSAVDGVEPRQIAVAPGAGESRIAAAIAEECDVLVTGDISHHRMVEATDGGLSVVDVGHAASERPGMARLRTLVAETLSIEVTVLDGDE